MYSLWFCFSSGMESYMRDPKLKTALEKRHLTCKCQFCSMEMWSPLVDRANLRQDPLWKNGIELIFMEINAFRQLPLNIIERYERTAIECLKKYDNQHPVRDTISMQELLLIIWNVLPSLY